MHLDALLLKHPELSITFSRLGGQWNGRIMFPDGSKTLHGGGPGVPGGTFLDAYKALDQALGPQGPWKHLYEEVKERLRKEV